MNVSLLILPFIRRLIFLLESILIPAKLITLPTIKGILQSKGFGVFPQDFKAS